MPYQINGSNTKDSHAMEGGVQILLVEDEQDLAQMIMVNLTALNFRVFHAASLHQAKALLQAKRIDLVLLDRMLPDGDGLLLCQQLRNAGQEMPVMLLTARDGEADTVLGLESGADDYMTKPFSVLELRARAKALLRRRLTAAPSRQLIEFEGLRIDVDSREVVAFDNPLPLTAKEFDLLAFLARHPQQVFSRTQLLDAVWGYRFDGFEHTVNSHINRLRGKLAHIPGSRELVQTVWGVGYKFAPPAAQAALH
ncbi:response regulator transcription factor [Shewanella khirikhana]|uniref:Alkaline phosphatase synthesis transcriptional regulatory protein PhoP n=1 Tax=Shewanella khirikhana TaxID=1965282 RepID=A0ABM7DWZ6_9GAMM|nr:Alkaline phosphatase synthesis transcriptional regulatory protein PhoP [Shewanella khirikhana]